jgi:putative ABC transport system permease protein
LESGAGVGTAFASLLVLVVGVVITNQTLAGAVMASAKEYASLRALGVSKWSLQVVVMEQAFWLGSVGLACTGVLTAGAALAADAAGIAMAFPVWMLVVVVVLVYAIALTSGLMALKSLLSADPASLLR